MSFQETIFLTGFPGFIAGRLVKRLANKNTRLFLLTQKNFIDQAQKLAQKIAVEKDMSVRNFQIMEGDIRQPNLGLTASDFDLVWRETTSVFHLAAAYDLTVEKDVAYSVNVEGTKNVNGLVKKIKQLQRYNYVSTCYVAGKRNGVILETELTHEAGFRNYYEETKYLAEIEVEDLKRELPVTIFRPSVVCGDSRTGETAKYDGIYYLIKYLLRFPLGTSLANIGNTDATLNLVPVDFVVDGIAVLSKDGRSFGKTVHLADPNPLTTKQLFDTVAQSIAGRKSLITLPKNMIHKMLLWKITPAISGLPHSGVPYFFQSQTFDTKIATELLKPHGVRCPRFESYVKTLVKYVEKHPKLTSA